MTELDKCEICKGKKGGVLGNENVIGSTVICDYCTSALFDFKKQGHDTSFFFTVPVVQRDGKWYHYDETWSERDLSGPFDTENGAWLALYIYAEYNLA